MRHYPPEQNRQGPGPEPSRGPSPPPPGHYAPPPPPPSQQQQPQQQQPPHQPLPQQPLPPRQSQPLTMIRNPNHHSMPENGINGAAPTAPGMIGYHRTNSPRNDQRPAHDNRMPSPKSAYPQHQPTYPPHPDAPGPSGVDGAGRPPPPAAMNPESSMHREHDRPPSVGPKRMREWEDDAASAKKPASDENRARLEDMRHRRPSTPPRDREPYRRNSSEARRFEDQRRMEDQRRVEDQRRAEDMRRVEEQRHASDTYHPSEAAHHPPAHAMTSNHLPPMQQGPPQMPNIMHDGPSTGPAPKEYSQDERQHERPHPPTSHPPVASEPERAARKMDVDEDYDDSGEDEKKNGIIPGAGSGPGSSSGDMKAATTSAGLNGIMGPKVESS